MGDKPYNKDTLLSQNATSIDKVPPEDNKKGSRWKEGWTEFTQNTTMHGMRQVGEPLAKPLRR